MRLRDSELKGLAVETETGQRVGKVSGFVVDCGTHMVIQYMVSRSRRLSSLLPSDLSVHYTQVVSMDDKAMVVRGNLEEMEAAAKSFQRQVREAATSAVPSRMEPEKAS